MKRRCSNLRYQPWHLNLKVTLLIVLGSSLLTLFSRHVVDPINQLPLISWMSGFVIGLELARIRPNRWAIAIGMLLADSLSGYVIHSPLSHHHTVASAALGAHLFWQSLTGDTQQLPLWLKLLTIGLSIWAILLSGWIARGLLERHKIHLDLLKTGEITRLLLYIGPLLALLPVLAFFISNAIVVLAFVGFDTIVLTDTTTLLLESLSQSHTEWLVLAAQQTQEHGVLVWSSHCLGALLLAPLLLRLIPQAPFAQQERAVLLPVSAFLVLAIVIQLTYAFLGHQRLQKEFNHLADQWQQRLSGELDKVSVQVKAFKAFFESSNRINEASFDKFYAGDARNQQSQHPVNIFWLSRIANEQRMPFERHLASAGIRSPNIKYSANHHTQTSAPPTRLYFPVTYVSNKRIRNHMTGYDWYSHPTLQAALLKAANTQRISATSLTQGTDITHFLNSEPPPTASPSSSLFLVAPVYHEQSHSSFGSRTYERNPLPQLTHSVSMNQVSNKPSTYNVGFIAASIALNTLIEQLSRLLPHPVAIQIEHIMSDGQANALIMNPLNHMLKALAGSNPISSPQGMPLSYHFILAERIIPYEHNIVIGDQLFRLRISPLLSTMTRLQHRYQWLYYCTMVLITVCVLFMTLHLSARDLLVRQIVIARTEHLRESTRKADIISQAKTRFLASMSHEFMTPLNAIIGFTRRVVDKERQNLAPRHLSALESVEANGLKLLGIIHNLINITDLESGQVKLNVAQVNIDDCLTDALQPLLKSIQHKGLSIRRFISYEFPIVADQKRCIEILYALLKNAVEHTNSGTITIFVKPEKRHQQRGVLIRIQDTGCGLSKEQQQKLLDDNANFKDINSRVNQRIGGLGAGFNAAKALIKLHHGELNLQSQLNKGTSVYIWLPAHPATDEDDTSRLTSSAPQAPK